MRPNLLFSLLAIILIFSSCSKSLEDRIIGSWQQEDAWRQVFLGREHFSTGYETGIFTFMENGDATYVSGTDTMTGYWRSGRRNYSNSNGQSESGKYLHISLINFQQNKRLEWEFDNFNFRDSWQEIRAEQYSLSNDRVYEFERR